MRERGGERKKGGGGGGRVGENPARVCSAVDLVKELFGPREIPAERPSLRLALPLCCFLRVAPPCCLHLHPPARVRAASRAAELRTMLLLLLLLRRRARAVRCARRERRPPRRGGAARTQACGRTARSAQSSIAWSLASISGSASWARRGG
mgnify:FL=1